MKKYIIHTIIIIGIVALSTLHLHGIDLAKASDSEYPTKPITFYGPYGAGGTYDCASRPLLEAAGKYLGQPFIVINKPGGSGTKAAWTVINSKPDGYTLGGNTASPIVIMPHTGYAPFEDLSGFTFICNFAKPVLLVFCRADAPWKTWNEFIDWVRENPGEAKIGITGSKSTNPMGMGMWLAEQKEKVKFTYIVYKSSSAILTSLLGGHIKLHCSSIDASSISYIKEGKLRILAYFTDVKAPGYENIPTFSDLYGTKLPNLMGIYGPKGLPDYVLRKLDNAFAKALKDPNYVNVMNRMHTPIIYMNRAEVNKEINELFPQVGKIMKAIKAEE
jgi:tripartite-type tricarboxylate transporter receptor subunit TctC